LIDTGVFIDIEFAQLKGVSPVLDRIEEEEPFRLY